MQCSLETNSLGQALLNMEAILREPAKHINSFRDDLSDYAADQARRGLSERWIADTQIVLSSIARKTETEPERWIADTQIVLSSIARKTETEPRKMLRRIVRPAGSFM